MIFDNHPTNPTEKNQWRKWVYSSLLLTIGVAFGFLVMDLDKKIGNVQLPHNIEFLIVYWMLCFFFLIYGIARIALGSALSGAFHPLVAVISFVLSVVLALLMVTYSAQQLYVLQFLLLLLFPLLALLPVLLYISFLAIKRKPLLRELELNLDRIYSLADQSSKEIKAMYRQKFEHMFGSDKDSPTFLALLPIVLTTMLMSLGWLYIASKVIYTVAMEPSKAIAFDPVSYGFIGVYLFSLNFLFRRYIQSDLGPVAYSNVNLRLITTLIWAMLLWNLEEVAYVNVLAFAVGIFPDLGWQWLVKRLQSLTKIGTTDQSMNYPLSQICGMTIWVENRLLEEDIENVHSLATANLPELLLQTNFSLGRLIDWIDQAIFQTHLNTYKRRPEDSVKAIADDLGLNGIITASAFLTYYHDQCRPKDESGLLTRLASEIENEANFYHINVWHATYCTHLLETVSP